MGRTVAKEVTNRNEVRAAIAAGGWNVVWGDLINEGDLLTFAISIPTGTVGGWVAQQVQAQLAKFAQSLGDVSIDVVEQATYYLEGLMKGRGSGEMNIHGLGVKGGFATYNRHMEYFLWGEKVCSHVLPKNHQPYITLRVTKPLPPKGPVTEPPSSVFKPVYQEGALGNGIGNYDLRSSADQAFAFDYDHSGKTDHLILFRPGTGTMWILKNTGGIFKHVYAEGDPGNGIGGFDLRSSADRAFAFDFDHSGKLDYLVLYRPGTGTMWILRRD
jgi:hypothetical protein